MKKIILNLGCGKTRIPGSIGVDMLRIESYVDLVCDLNMLPFPFKDESIDEIHMYHVLEHLQDPLGKMEELYRILKPRGMIYMRVPHFSSLGAFSDITHVRPFGFTSFDILEQSDYHHFYSSLKVIAQKGRRIQKAKFKIIYKEIKYSGLYPNKGLYAKYIHPNTCFWFVKPFVRMINFFIKLSPIFFERIWCYWVGGATEIVVVMQKEM